MKLIQKTANNKENKYTQRKPKNCKKQNKE